MVRAEDMPLLRKTAGALTFDSSAVPLTSAPVPVVTGNLPSEKKCRGVAIMLCNKSAILLSWLW